MCLSHTFLPVLIGLSLPLLPLAATRPASASTIEGLPAELRLDQIQYIGTHNSYHIAPGAEITRLMLATHFTLSEDWPAERLAEATDYTHPALTVQLERGLRLFELDVHDDPRGGRFADPAFLRLRRNETVDGAPLPIDPSGLAPLRQPGFKVLHHPDWDFRSNNYLLTDSLSEIVRWSQAHPEHLPIVMQIEVKTTTVPAVSGAGPGTDSPEFTADTWRRLESTIRTTVPANRLVTPDDIRGHYHDLPTALARRGWPTLGELRGKIIFLLLNTKGPTQSYLQLNSRLRGRVFFASVRPGGPAAAWYRIPDPTASILHEVIAAGGLATTMADAHTRQSRDNDPTQRDEAFASGAQFIITDYPQPDLRFSDYQVTFPGGSYVRPNPVRVSADRDPTKAN